VGGGKKRMSRWIGLCLLLCGLLGVILWISKPDRIQTETRAETLNPANPRHKKMLCGPMALYNVFGRLGINSRFQELATHCEISRRGVVLAELERVAQGVPEAKAHALRLDWDGLKRLDGAAVLFVKGNHFVAVDPREVPPDGMDKTDVVRMYDENRPAQWITQEKLEAIWNGEALAVERPQPSKQEAGPRIEWDTCFIDNGIVKPGSTGRYPFTFRNTGDQELLLERVNKGCGCTEYTVTSKRLRPGERGVITAVVDFRGSEGYFRSNLIVKTNDAANPLSVLRVAAGIPTGRVLCANRQSLGNVPQGGKIAWEFYVTDPGFDGLRIREVSFVSSLDAAEHLTSVIAYDRLGDAATRITKIQGVRHKPEDYVVRVTLRAGEKCPVGPFQGEAIVVVAVGEDISAHKIAVTGDIVPDVFSVPSIALISLDDQGAGSATVQLRSHAKQEFRVIATWVDNESLVMIAQDSGPEVPGGVFILSARAPDIIAGSEPIESTAFFKLEKGDVVRVPVVVVRPANETTHRESTTYLVPRER
jgi:hypothetical protein